MVKTRERQGLPLNIDAIYRLRSMTSQEDPLNPLALVRPLHIRDTVICV